MTRKKALTVYLTGAFGQILMVSAAVFILRRCGVTVGYTTPAGLAAIAVGGVSSAVWGTIAAVKYKKIRPVKVLKDFINVKQKPQHYLLALSLLLLDFLYVLFGGRCPLASWYQPIVLFFTALIFGGIEEIGWRYLFQPMLQEKHGYILSTLCTFAAWGVWHWLFFYIDGSLPGIVIPAFYMGLLTNCFILSTVYNVTGSLWLCAMTHSLINVFSQLVQGGSGAVSWICRALIFAAAVLFSMKSRKTKS